MAKAASETLTLDGHAVTVSNPAKVYFPEAGITKLELVHSTTSPSRKARCAASRAGRWCSSAT